MRDFKWEQELYCVIKDDGTYAGRACLTLEEACELSYQHYNSKIYKLELLTFTTEE